MSIKVYLAGAITGLTYKEAIDWRKKVTKKLKTIAQTLDPMRGKAYLSKEKAIASCYPGSTTSGTKAVYKRDRFDISRADVVLVNLKINNGSYSVGTLVEIGMADAWGKLIILIADKSVIHPFLIENSIQFEDLDMAIEYIRKLEEQ